MRSRLVIWGSNAQNEKVLLAIHLDADDNKVHIDCIPEKDVNEEYYNQMMTVWREGGDVAIPSSSEHRITELTASESILPDDIKVERGDMIQRAQMEWHFVVLSTKLYKNYKNELDDLTDKVKRLELFDHKIWDELVGFWEPIQKHIFDRNLFKDHSDSLKAKVNSLFDELKVLRKNMDSEVKQKSREILESFKGQIEGIQERILGGSALKPLFDDLKKIQNDFKQSNVTREDRSIIMKKLDEAFEEIRKKRQNGAPAGTEDNTDANRLNKRYDGLIQAIQKMEQSIARDQKDIEFENKRIASSNGQLEAQIRVAKIRMIEERIKSKQQKLDELLLTKTKLEKAKNNTKKREEKLAERAKNQELIDQEKAKIINKISEEIQTSQTVISDEETAKLKKAADEIRESKKTKSADATSESDSNPSSETIEEETISESTVETEETVMESVDELLEEAKELTDPNEETKESES